MALEVVRVLKAPMDLVFVRKIGMPGHSEYAAGAVVNGDRPQLVLNEDIVRQMGVSKDYLDKEFGIKLEEIERRRRSYLKDHTATSLEGRTVVVVDDGIATGASVRAALKAVRRQNPKFLILAIPVAPKAILPTLTPEVDEIICLQTPDPFVAIGLHYSEFHQLSDREVVAMIAEADQILSA